MISLVLAIIGLVFLFLPSWLPHVGLAIGIIMLIVSFCYILKTKKGIYYAALAFSLITIIWYIILLILNTKATEQFWKDAEVAVFEAHIANYITDLELLQLPEGEYNCDKVKTINYAAPTNSFCSISVDENHKVTLTLIGSEENISKAVCEATSESIKTKGNCD